MLTEGMSGRLIRRLPVSTFSSLALNDQVSLMNRSQLQVMVKKYLVGLKQVAMKHKKEQGPNGQLNLSSNNTNNDSRSDEDNAAITITVVTVVTIFIKITVLVILMTTDKTQ